MGKTTSTDNEGERGPGWRDCYELHLQLQSQYNDQVDCTMEQVPPRDGKWGTRIVARLRRNPHIFGCGSYGPLFPSNGSRTMSGATYRALVQLDAAASGDWVNYTVTDKGKEYNPAE